MNDPAVLVSVSGGKDSTATLLLALERLPKERIFPAFADTGHEHPLTYEYLDYLQRETGLAFKRLRADFTSEWWHRRDFVRDFWPQKGVPADIVARVMAVMERGPTGNPFLDLCVIKAKFPSRRSQFCTQHLKRYPLDAYAIELMGKHGVIENWQGVRADESENRKNLPEREAAAEGWTIVRPVLRWTAADVFAQHRKHGIKPNPLYKQGMNRVGCFPCINVSKGELWNISERYPEHIARVREWEALVSDASKRGQATFFHAHDPEATPNVNSFVEWSRTAHGGRQLDLLKSAGPPAGCVSSYGLCDLGDDDEKSNPAPEKGRGGER